MYCTTPSLVFSIPGRARNGSRALIDLPISRELSVSPLAVDQAAHPVWSLTLSSAMQPRSGFN